MRWTYAALAGRVDILTQALDASPDPQLILAPDGRIAYANTAYRELFPLAHERPMPAIAAALADPDAMPDFERLRSRAAQGARAIAALPLRYSRGSAVGWFTISVNPIAGRPGYSFWDIQDITARHEMEALIRDERNKLVEFLNDAPVGFYSVDSAGRFLFVNQTLAEWLGSTPAEIVGSDARLHDFLAVAPPDDALPWDPLGGRDDGGQRGEVAFKSRNGRIAAGVAEPEHGRQRARAAHPLGRARPDPGAPMGIGAAPVARALPALFRQCAGRDRADRPVRQARGGEPRARRSVRRAASGADRPEADRFCRRGGPARSWPPG